MPEHTYRLVEIVGTSPDGVDAAVRNGIQRAGRTLRNIDWFEVTEIRGHLQDGEVADWQVGIKVGFRIEDL
ncbi:MAG: dodecin [Pseudonocardiales bacterium]|nr:dodecin [Pseudonocardiales bacterium]MDT7578491.1 dodecin [Pseudonocardiales bacterium]